MVNKIKILLLLAVVALVVGFGIDQMQKVPYFNILRQTSEKCRFVASNPSLFIGS
jgi:hypothetical protein